MAMRVTMQMRAKSIGYERCVWLKRDLIRPIRRGIWGDEVAVVAWFHWGDPLHAFGLPTADRFIEVGSRNGVTMGVPCIQCAPFLFTTVAPA
jgi:hypothetical protein